MDKSNLFNKIRKQINFDKIKYKNLINVNRLNPKNIKVNQYLKPQIWIEKLQDKVDKITTNDDNNEVNLKQPKYWAQAITWVLMGSAGFGIGWISIAETEQIVIALGKLEPKGGVIDVQMPVEGVAREILVSEGEQVTKGQLLIRLDTEITEARNEALKTSLDMNNTIKNKLSYLVEEGAVSELRYMEQLAKIEEIKSKIKTNTVQLRYKEIISPANGMVFDLQPKGPGYVARTSQPVLKIVPLNNLVAKVEIDSRSIGFVKPGKKADISIDSFPARDYGVIEGTVKRIGSDALPPEEGKGYRFPADISLKNQFLKIKDGKKLPLKAGMSLTANIKLRKLTYLKLLLNNFVGKADSLKSI